MCVCRLGGTISVFLPMRMYPVPHSPHRFIEEVRAVVSLAVAARWQQIVVYQGANTTGPQTFFFNFCRCTVDNRRYCEWSTIYVPQRGQTEVGLFLPIGGKLEEKGWRERKYT